MRTVIREKLRALGCDAWELAETKREGWEFYLIRHRLDQNRAVMSKTISVTVYKAAEDGTSLGRASGEIAPTASEEEIDRRLADLVFQAGLVRNPVYTLNDRPLPPAEERPQPDPEEIAAAFLRAVREVPETASEDINSYEIFVNILTRHYENSSGVTYTCRWPESMAEVVVNARREGHEIELYRNFRSGTCDEDRLKDELTRAMQFGKDRLIAEPTPQLGVCDVVFSTEDAVQIYDYFVDRMSAGYKVRGLSSWEEGSPIDPALAGDRICVEAVSELPNSSHNVPVDEEGALIADRFLIRDGAAEHFWGSRQFSQYLGLKESSQVYNLRVSGGTHTAGQLREGRFLEVVEFSDFQVDSMGGDIAGEIRLGYLHENGQVRIVTGGSVSGSMTEAVRSMKMSRNTVQYDTREIPAVTRLAGLRITGAEDC